MYKVISLRTSSRRTIGTFDSRVSAVMALLKFELEDKQYGCYEFGMYEVVKCQ